MASKPFHRSNTFGRADLPRRATWWSTVVAIVLASFAMGTGTARSNEEYESQAMEPTGAATTAGQVDAPTATDMGAMRKMRDMAPVATRGPDGNAQHERRQRPPRNDALDLQRSVGLQSQTNVTADPPLLLPPTRVRPPVSNAGDSMVRLGDLLAARGSALHSVARTCDPDDPKNQVFVRNENVSPPPFVEPL